jgi:hypothetical protein
MEVDLEIDLRAKYRMRIRSLQNEQEVAETLYRRLSRSGTRLLENRDRCLRDREFNGGCRVLRVCHVVAVRLPVVSPQLHLRPVLNARMSAIPTDEPAQDAPPSLDTQQIQQQLQQQDPQLNPQSVSAEPNRKRS